MGKLKEFGKLADFKIKKQKTMLRKNIKIEDQNELIKNGT